MDEVLQQLENTIISQDSGTDSKTNFDGLYKNWGRLGNQEERRKEILEVQKSNRNNKLDKFRGILELVNAVQRGEIFRTQKKQAYYRPTIYVAGFNKVSPTYSNVLMMSEWIVEKPEDLQENWYVVPCPQGVRVLVVANNGTTKCYSKYGHFKFETYTGLPGGNQIDFRSRKHCCVLDGFYYQDINTLFVLDVLAWNSQPMTDGETEFRHYWIECQLAETPDLRGLNRKNKMIFKLLPKIPCNPEDFNKYMKNYPAFEHNYPPLDGLLFYHKRAHYIAGETPLVGWLYPFMVPEILGSDFVVHEKYMVKPENYVNYVDYIQKFEEKYGKKKNKNKNTPSNAMDTADSNNPQGEKKKKKKRAMKDKSKTTNMENKSTSTDMEVTENDSKTRSEASSNLENDSGSITSNEMEIPDGDKKDNEPLKEVADASSELTSEMETADTAKSANTEIGGATESTE